MLCRRHAQKSCKIRQIINDVIKFCLLKFLGTFPIFKNDCVQQHVSISTEKFLSDNYKSSNIKMKLNLKRCNICDLIWLFSLLLVKSKDSFIKLLNLCAS